MSLRSLYERGKRTREKTQSQKQGTNGALKMSQAHVKMEKVSEQHFLKAGLKARARNGAVDKHHRLQMADVKSQTAETS